MRKIWLAIEVLFALTAIALVALFVCYASPHPAGKPEKDIWDVLTAIGTMGAVVTAVVLGLRQEGSRKKEEFLRARMVAARLIPRLEQSAQASGQLEGWLDFYDSIEKTELPFFDAMLHQIEVIHLKPSLDELAALAPLPNRCAFRLAHGVGQIEHVRSVMRARRENLATNPLKSAEATKLANAVGSAALAFTFALAECKAAAGPLYEITDDERYGDPEDYGFE